MTDEEAAQLARVALQASYLLARTLRQPKVKVPPLTALQRKWLAAGAALLDREGRLEAAEILGTAARAAREDLRGARDQWDQETDDLNKHLKKLQAKGRGAVGGLHPAQSWDAATLIMPNIGSQWRVILDMMEEDVRSGKNDGLTPHEAGLIISPHRIGTTNTRFQELRGERQEMNFGTWIQLRGDKRTTTGRNKSAVHEFTMIARTRLGLLVGPEQPPLL